MPFVGGLSAFLQHRTTAPAQGDRKTFTKRSIAGLFLVTFEAFSVPGLGLPIGMVLVYRCIGTPTLRHSLVLSTTRQSHSCLLWRSLLRPSNAVRCSSFSSSFFPNPDYRLQITDSVTCLYHVFSDSPCLPACPPARLPKYLPCCLCLCNLFL